MDTETDWHRSEWSRGEDDVARLILMGLQDGSIPRTRDRLSLLGDFVDQYRAEYPGAPLVQCKRMYSKYMGFDGREFPTHSLQSGAPIR